MQISFSPVLAKMSHDHHHAAAEVHVPEIPNKPSWTWRLTAGPAGRRNLIFFACSSLALYLMGKFSIDNYDNSMFTWQLKLISIRCHYSPRILTIFSVFALSYRERAGHFQYVVF